MKSILAQRRINIRRKVLIVDDETINRMMLKNILNISYETLEASDGKEALEMIREREKSLSLILLDLNMPNMSGYELLRILQNDAVLHRIPVIVLTAERKAEVECLELGAVDFIHKPFELPTVILARVRRSIELAEDSILISATETDSLTGLYNKDYFFQYASGQDGYDPDTPMDAAVLNVNRLYIVNELHGKEYGDLLLRHIGEKIRLFIQQANGIAGRSEDRFLLYVPHRDDWDGILNEISEEAYADDKASHASLRMGIYQNVDKQGGLNHGFECAMIACNTVKSEYFSDLAYYDRKLYEQEMFSERLIMDIDKAIEEKQFLVYYQPKYRITGEAPELCSAEALVRWKHPEFGMVSPGAFIPLFEKHGLIHKLDRFVWHEAAGQIARWKQKYGVSVPVSVNISRSDMYDTGLDAELLDIVKQYGLSPGEYYLEVTESAYADNYQQIIDTVNRFRECGFKVEMDDFGSGYSSLNMLASLPIDALKLDMQFVKHIETSEKDLRLIRIMIDLARMLSVPTIAEGVETKEQYMLLKEAGCDVLQGYYFSRPVPPDEFEKFIEAEIKRKGESL